METGHSEPTGLVVVNGEARISDINISAALLSLSGAAWDGRTPPLYEPDESETVERQRWHDRLNEPGVRQIAVRHVGHHFGVVYEPVMRKDGWTDKTTGKHYEPDEIAPFNRVVYHLRGEYCYRTNGEVTRRVPFAEADWRFWFSQWFKRGGLLSAARVLQQRRNELLDVAHDEFEIVGQLRVNRSTA